MSIDLLAAAKNLFNNYVVAKASSQLGERETDIQKTCDAIAPVLYTGLLHKTAATANPSGLLHLTKEAATYSNSETIIEALNSELNEVRSKGHHLLQHLFGNKVHLLVISLSAYAGIREISAQALLASASTATIGIAGKYATENNLTPDALLTLLYSQKDKISGAVPAGLNLANLLGLSNLEDLGKNPVLAGSSTSADVSTLNMVRQSSGNRWIWPIFLLLVAMVLLWYLMRGCGGNKPINTPTTDSVTTQQLTDSAVLNVTAGSPKTRSEYISVMLPDGIILDAYKGGTEDKLVTFLQDKNRKPGRNNWFNLDQLNFKDNSAELTEDSRNQVNNIAAIMKAFPKASIIIGAYTDRAGDSMANLELSLQRAASVMTALKKRHTNAAQLLGAAGYGSQFAKAPANAPEAERKKDRHISICVRKK